MTVVAVGIGSNIGPAKYVPWALKELASHGLLKASPIYVTAPLDRPEQGMYWNCVARLETNATADELRTLCRSLEAAAGRVRSDDAWAARTLDMDVLWVGDAPNDEDARTEIEERPWNAWGIHRVGLGPTPASTEPPRVE